MSLFPSILVPLDGSATAAKSLGCAAWLAGRMDAHLHILSATTRVLPARAELARLKVPREYWLRIMLHQVPEYAENAILTAISRYAVQLVVLTSHGRAAETPAEKEHERLKIVGHVTHAVIERSPVPVLVLPRAYREVLPWVRALVPLSGEAEADAALTLAVRLANALDLAVHVAHVSETGAGKTGIEAWAHYADQPHHEYPGHLKEFVSRAVPHCSPEECRCIQEVSLARGDIAAELLQLIKEKRISLLVVGWHGRFMIGHAEVLKRLIQTVTCPVLLVKPAPQPPFRLKVGEEIEEG